ncbi:GNAT family N-acetyltransferase [Salinicoccus albus]|uniref:GNAT family N-acetyltransferase n=1 Tax=Salinicoccus albus TaxID=418756 RepID=UPI000364F8DB|nr:GNAT family N-acetyltransferase [Salinicoccus albus]
MKLRALEEEDLNFLYGLKNDYSIMTNWFEEPFNSLTELKDAYSKNFKNESVRQFVIENDNKTLVGIVYLVSIDYIHRNCEIEIIVKPEYSGRGFAKFAFNEASQYAFEILNMHKVYLYVDTENEKAIAIYHKQGFKTEGVLREHFYTKGTYRDAAFMSILKSEWDVYKKDNEER